MYTQLLYIVVALVASMVHGKGIIMEDNRLAVEKTAETVESFELKKIPHRIYLAGKNRLVNIYLPKFSIPERTLLFNPHVLKLI